MNTVKDIMTTDVLCVPADWSLERLSQFFFDNHISGAPVVDSEDMLVGVVSVTDLAHNKALSAETNVAVLPHDFYIRGILEHKFTKEESFGFQFDENLECVNDIMTPMVFELDENTSVQKAAEVMLRGRIHRIFVTHAKKIIGVVSAMDMLKVIRDRRFDGRVQRTSRAVELNF